MRLLKKYRNGNYKILMFNDGTKVRVLDKGEKEFKPEYPESIDLCISHKCSIGCPYCYNDCKATEKIADFESHKVKRFLETLNPGMELAIGGGAITEINMTDLHDFLEGLKLNDVIVNITFNIKEFLNGKIENPIQFLKELTILRNVYGIGISYDTSSEAKDMLVKINKSIPNVVVHTIAGVTTKEDYLWLAENNFKVLVLGYKLKGRGINYNFSHDISENLNWAKENILSLRDKFKTLSFDCLAVEQLDVKSQVSEDIWNSNYMGKDGDFTMYVDLVNCMFAKSSTASEDEFNHFSFQAYCCDDMFRYIRKNNK